VVVNIRKRTRGYENRQEIECVTVTISMLSRSYSGKNEIVCMTAHLDEGLSTEREVSWIYAEDHPVFVFRQ
jgi:hypothetical protein